MKLGDNSIEVKIYQERVNNHYQKRVLTVDGRFGPRTEFYTRKVQTDLGLPVTGEADPKTVEAVSAAQIQTPTAEGLYPPFANVMPEKMATRGTYAHGYPYGAVVHFTAGRPGARKTILGAINAEPNKRYTFWCIDDITGKLFCAHPVHLWGWHCGQGRWSKFVPFLKDSLNDDCIGIEMNAAGKLDPIPGLPGKFKSWFGQVYDQSEVRYVDGSSPDQEKGYYHKYTPEQEATLIATLLWLKSRNPAVFDFDCVVGHCEISGMLGIGRWAKNDPGGALSMTMPQLRALLKKLWANLNGRES